jgi:anti-sigma regulatory factor (Ser/Thr protein kinase)
MAGEVAVVAATAAHRLALEAELARAGVDCSAAQSAGRLLVVDAAETLRGFLAGDRLDPSRFRAAAGDLLGRAADAGHPVRVYAEMVALLWDAGQVTLALELEALWNDLASHLPFSLLCTYPLRLVSAAGSASALEEVCSLHTAVIGPDPSLSGEVGVSVHGAAVRSFPPDREATRAARQFVSSLLASRADPALSVDAEIVTGELAANAVLHARSAFTVAVAQSAAGVRISVRDAGPVPVDRDEALVITPGHGLDVVAKAAVRWAVEPLPDGKVVWAELPAQHRPA